jgi:undecaprenyl-diphosphatase
MNLRLQDMTIAEQVLLALSFLLLSLLIFDPLIYEQARALPRDVRVFFAAITDIGRSAWMLIPTGAAIALALVLRRRHIGFRNEASYGLIASTLGFVFISVGGAALITNVVKQMIGRARPILFDAVGPFDFEPFSFSRDYESLPSGHAANIFALASALAILWPRRKALTYTFATCIAASRVLIGEHYFTDIAVGAAMGAAFPYLVRNFFAARRWFFERTAKGGYRVRGERTRRWLGWPGSGSQAVNVGLSGNKGKGTEFDRH